jgi:hypothetical protein
MLPAALFVTVLILRWFNPGIRYHRMRYYHMTWLEYGVLKFKHSNGAFPTNIAQVVQAGILPDQSEIYACPLALENCYPTFPGLRDYHDCDYTLIASNEVLSIQVRSDVAERIRLKHPEIKIKDLTLETQIGTDLYIGNGDGTPATPPGKWR